MKGERINVAAVLIIGADFAMMLAALMLVLPPTSYAWPVLAPHVVAALPTEGAANFISYCDI